MEDNEEMALMAEQAIKEYGQTKLDFVDCVLIAYNKLGISRVFTFDKEINRELVKSGK